MGRTAQACGPAVRWRRSAVSQPARSAARRGQGIAAHGPEHCRGVCRSRGRASLDPPVPDRPRSRRSQRGGRRTTAPSGPARLPWWGLGHPFAFDALRVVSSAIEPDTLPPTAGLTELVVPAVGPDQGPLALFGWAVRTEGGDVVRPGSGRATRSLRGDLGDAGSAQLFEQRQAGRDAVDRKRSGPLARRLARKRQRSARYLTSSVAVIPASR